MFHIVHIRPVLLLCVGHWLQLLCLAEGLRALTGKRDVPAETDPSKTDDGFDFGGCFPGHPHATALEKCTSACVNSGLQKELCKTRGKALWQQDPAASGNKPRWSKRKDCDEGAFCPTMCLKPNANVPQHDQCYDKCWRCPVVRTSFEVCTWNLTYRKVQGWLYGHYDKKPSQCCTDLCGKDRSCDQRCAKIANNGKQISAVNTCVERKSRAAPCEMPCDESFLACFPMHPHRNALSACIAKCVSGHVSEVECRDSGTLVWKKFLDQGTCDTYGLLYREKPLLTLFPPSWSNLRDCDKGSFCDTMCFAGPTGPKHEHCYDSCKMCERGKLLNERRFEACTWTNQKSHGFFSSELARPLKCCAEVCVRDDVMSDASSCDEHCISAVLQPTAAKACKEKDEGGRRPGQVLPNSDLPKHWSSKGRQTSEFVLVPMRETSDEFSRIKRIFGLADPKDLGKGRDVQIHIPPYSRLEVKHVWRIENPFIWRKYQLKNLHVKQELSNLAKRPGLKVKKIQTEMDKLWKIDSDVNEKFFLHGTKPDFVKDIVSKGLNEHYSSIEGLFGAGIYLADRVEKIDQYVTPDGKLRTDKSPLEDLHKLLATGGSSFKSWPPGSNIYYAFVCRAVLGYPIVEDTGRVDSHFVSAQKTALINIPNSDPKLAYHSLIGTVMPSKSGNPLKLRFKEYVLYEHNQVYPEYLLAYERK